MRVFHLTTAGDWAQAQRAGAYTLSTRGRTLEEEGYIHCSEPHQVEPVRRRYYEGVPDLVLLEVETDLLTAPWRCEQLPGMSEAFPHVYGPIDLAAVVGVRPVTEEVKLTGGTTEGVVRVGDTVRRPRTASSTRVERLLVHLERVGADVAPRFLGIDERGRQVLEYVDGETPTGPPYDLTDAAQESAMRLVRRFHDATVGTEWAEGCEVACHGDLGPHNTVFRGAAAVRLLDWDDDVTGGRRAVDVADAAWGFADLTSDTVPVAEQARRLSLCCHAYGDVTPAVVVDELLAYFGRARRNHLAAGRDRPRAVFEQLIAWTERNAQVLAGGPDPR